MTLSEKVFHKFVQHDTLLGIQSEIGCRHLQCLSEELLKSYSGNMTKLVEEFKERGRFTLVHEMIKEALEEITTTGVTPISFLRKKLVVSPQVEEDVIIMHPKTFEMFQKTFPPWQFEMKLNVSVPKKDPEQIFEEIRERNRELGGMDDGH